MIAAEEGERGGYGSRFAMFEFIEESGKDDDVPKRDKRLQWIWDKETRVSGVDKFSRKQRNLSNKASSKATEVPKQGALRDKSRLVHRKAIFLISTDFA